MIPTGNWEFFSKRPPQHVFLNAPELAAEMLVHRDSVSTIGKITVTMMNFLFQCYVFCGPYIYVGDSIV